MAFSDSTPEISLKDIGDGKFYSPSTAKEEMYMLYLLSKLDGFADLVRLKFQRGDLLVGGILIELKLWQKGKEGESSHFTMRAMGQMVTSPNEGDSPSCPSWLQY